MIQGRLMLDPSFLGMRGYKGCEEYADTRQTLAIQGSAMQPDANEMSFCSKHMMGPTYPVCEVKAHVLLLAF